MTVDLSKARAGDTVKFRCGIQAPIDDIDSKQSEHRIELFWIKLRDSKFTAYSRGGVIGSYHFDEGSPFDIIEVIPQAASHATERSSGRLAVRKKQNQYLTMRHTVEISG